MSSIQASLAYELFRPTITRHVPIIGALLVASVLLINAMDSEPTVIPDESRDWIVESHTETVKAGELDVPVYYYPDAATGTDRYVTTKDGDCGTSTSTAPVDYPKDWLKP